MGTLPRDDAAIPAAHCARQSMLPNLPPLPIDALQGELQHLRDAAGPRRVVISSPTGSGKSTRVPIWCAFDPRRPARTLVVEPRRVACRSLARHVAQLTGARLGKEVGYAVRYEAAFDPGTRVVFATPGTVLRMLQPDPRRGDPSPLPGWDTLILDELHERHLDVDLLLAFALHLQLPEIIAMSATLDAERVAAHMDAHLLHAQGRLYPVSLEHHDAPPLPTHHRLEERVTEALLHNIHRDGDALVFLPGKAEIHACEQALKKQPALRAWEILPLHGALPPEAQDRPFDAATQRRVILATNVAETSVTLPNIGLVIDSGLARQQRYHDGTSALRLVPIAQDAAEQRRGRAGRLRPGHCVRLWSHLARLDETTPPELLRAELTQPVLTAALCGLDLRRLPLLDAPRHYAIDAAIEDLQRWGCLDPDGAITPDGREIARLPLHPRLGRLLLEARAEGTHTLLDAIDLVASFAARSFILPADPEPSPQRLAWQEHRCDATLRILASRFGDPRRDRLAAPPLSEARQSAAQLRDLLRAPRQEPDTVDRDALLRAFLRADPRAAFARRKRHHTFSNEGTEVEAARDSLLHPDAEALVAAEIHTRKDPSGRVTHTVTCAIPTHLAFLRRAGLGRDIPLAPTIQRGVLTCTLARTFAGHTLAEIEAPPQGDAAREALLALLLQRRYLKDAVQDAAQDLLRFDLFRRLHHLPHPPPPTLEDHLRACILDLGFERGEDLPLLVPEDLRFTWPLTPDPRDLDALNRDFPFHIDLGDQRFEVEYDTLRRTVTLVQKQGPTRHLPTRRYLPRWAGWTVQVRRGNATSTLHG